MSHRRRSFLLYALVAVFFVTFPLIVLFANGYRLSKDWGIAETGGIHIASLVPGATLSIDGKKAENAGAFETGFFVQNFLPATYEVKVEKEGYTTWIKHISVQTQFVSEGFALLLPSDLRELSATTTAGEIADADVLFAAPQIKTEGILRSFPAGARMSRKVVISKQNGVYSASWRGTLDDVPYFFCTDECHPAIQLSGLPKDTLSFDFYPGRNDVLLVDTPATLYAYEIDQREPATLVPVFHGPHSGFRVADSGAVYVRVGTGAYGTIQLP